MQLSQAELYPEPQQRPDMSEQSLMARGNLPSASLLCEEGYASCLESDFRTLAQMRILPPSER